MSLKDLLVKNDFRFKKAFGQNFLTDETLLSSIAEKSGAGKDDTVLEIGVGAGTLTKQLASRVKKVVGYEIDQHLRPVLKESLASFNNIQVIFKDVLKVKTKDLEEEIGDDYFLVANLPYYITTPLIMRFVGEAERCKGITVMIQEEVALRLCAKENTPDYGAITVAIDAFCDAEIIERAPRTMFYPQPNVDSAVVKITFVGNKYGVLDREVFKSVVKSAFLMRRKTLVNNLISSFGLQRPFAEEILKECNIDISVRGEALSTKQFVLLSNTIANKNLKAKV